MSGAYVGCAVCAVSVGSPSAVNICPTPALAGQVVWSQSFVPSCYSCGLSSLGVSAAAFCPLGLLSHPILLLFLAWVSSFGVCSGLGLRAEVLVLDPPFFFWGGGGSFPCPCCFSLAFTTLLWSRFLGFLVFLLGFLSSRLPVFAGSSGWLTYSPWLYALRCLATGIVNLFSVRGLSACPSRNAVPLGSSVLRLSGSSRWGHLSQVGAVLPRSAIVTKTIPPSGGIGSGPSRWGPLSRVRAVFFSL